MDKNLLLIFVKNPVLGTVKTRLAASVGNEKALATYHKLLVQTKRVTEALSATRRVYYSTRIEKNDLWDDEVYEKKVQYGESLGTRMQNAFAEGFEDGYQRIVIIGSDCMELATSDIEDAFGALHSHDVVIGPATDGGYYLLGMKKLHKKLFQNKKWSKESVFLDTMEDIISEELAHYNLRTLSDVDNIQDVERLNIKI